MADKTSSGKQIHSTDAEAQIVGEHKRVPIGDIYPNPWNYNVQPDEMFRKLAQSIRMFGFIEPLIVRTRAAGGWEIVNGEHRWQAAKLLKLSELPVLDLGVVEDAKVKQMCIVLNELEGHPDQLRLAELLRDINITVPVEELELVMPFTNDELGMMINLPGEAAPHAGRPRRADRRHRRTGRAHLEPVAAPRLTAAAPPRRPLEAISWRRRG